MLILSLIESLKYNNLINLSSTIFFILAFYFLKLFINEIF